MLPRLCIWDAGLLTMLTAPDKNIWRFPVCSGCGAAGRAGRAGAEGWGVGGSAAPAAGSLVSRVKPFTNIRHSAGSLGVQQECDGVCGGG